jgi:SAM-dependent methyltransferase
MAPIDYLVLRTLRRMAPQKVVDWMLDQGVYLRPGRDTNRPDESVRMYCEAGMRAGQSIEGKRVLVFGYGGSFGVALGLLEAGAGHVYLQDPFAPARSARNRRLPADRMARFFQGGPHDWRPDPARVTIVREHLPDFARRQEATIDWVVSTSVFEHVADVEPNVAACAQITRPGGLNIHEIDLRDHYFRYPFEMLCHSEKVWTNWLNASNNLNRRRLPEYEAAFVRHFENVEVRVRLRLATQFAAAKERILEEFRTGDDEADAVGLIVIEARRATPVSHDHPSSSSLNTPDDSVRV